MLRKKIQDLQQYRRLGLSTAADIDKYINDVAKRVRTFIFLAPFTFDNRHTDSDKNQSTRVLCLGETEQSGRATILRP